MTDPKRVQQQVSMAVGGNLNEEDMRGMSPNYPDVSLADLGQSMGQLGRLDEVNLSDSLIYFLEENLPCLRREYSEKFTSFLGERLGRAHSPGISQQQDQQQPTAAADAACSLATASNASMPSFILPGQHAPTHPPAAACHPDCTAKNSSLRAFLATDAPMHFHCCYSPAYMSLSSQPAVPYCD
jgi:hypothetical protein